MNCPSCQQPLREGAQFCTNCGARTAHGAGASSADSVPTREPAGDAGGRESARAGDTIVGRVLDGKYEIASLLGEGGMGAVYRARRVHIGDEVAVKVLHARFVDDETLVERFRREARAAAQLQHPNVVTIHDYGEALGAEGFAYIVMELVRGVSLRELLRAEGRLGVGRAAALMRDVCAGVGAAHRRGIVHRDLKPDNVIVLPPEEDGEPERVKVVDFGIAKLRDMAGDGTLTQAGAMVGTPFYMSPEQCRGEHLDSRADVYSLGAMLYEMLSGAPPFNAPSITGVISKHLTEAPPPVPAQLDVPHGLQSAIARALAKDPQARQRDAAEFGREVQAAAADGAAQTTGAPHAANAPPPNVLTAGAEVSQVTAMPARPAQPPHAHAAGPEPQARPPQPAPHTPAQHPRQTFHPDPARRPGSGRLLLVLGVSGALLTGAVAAILLGLFYLGMQGGEADVNVNTTPSGNLATPVAGNRNAGAPSGEDLALAERIAVPEQKILGGAELTREDLAGLSQGDLRVLRNVPYARHGRVFQEARLQNYFRSRPWYSPDPNFSEGVLTAADRASADLIREYEGGGPRPTPADAATLAREVGDVLDAWVSSTSARDIGGHMSFYAPSLETYYQRQNVPAAVVRADRASAFSRYDRIDVEISNVEVATDPSGTRATATFDKTWEFDSDTRTSTGSVRQQLTLASVGGRWLITGERDLRVYYTNSEER